ncbi:NADPH:quinone reductase [Amycolatopsis australiensis]|uniref:NADPH2:quinone reductase n=1 Tax=Amycolatopsis australiensis TaxID=546364 RepID=A0A1K1SQV8_9PSEU|nr:NADPH:quinone reductase [Amycolatopsis australiensis]SFW86697.1 NADPH2:quinone reductase [Amycolatopsis australiensis]
MKAAVYRRPGPADEVLEVVKLERPEPGPGEVRVRMVTSGINPTDWKTRAGLTGRMPDGFQVPHHDGAGVVDAVGSGVTGLTAGQRVWLYLAAFGNRYGTAAEYAIVPAARVVPLPGHASDDLGACLGVPALTAAHCLGGDPDAVKGRTVLVAGGAGAVGHYAIELAKHAGARVVATVSSDDKRTLAERAGADLVVRYTDGDVAERIRDFAGPVDRVVEVAFGANLALDMAVLRPGGTIATYAAAGQLSLPVGEFMQANITLAFVLLYGLSAGQLSDAVRWTSAALAAGALSALPVLAYPLDRVAAAQERVAGQPVGKVVLRIAGN